MIIFHMVARTTSLVEPPINGNFQFSVYEAAEVTVEVRLSP